MGYGQGPGQSTSQEGPIPASLQLLPLYAMSLQVRTLHYTILYHTRLYCTTLHYTVLHSIEPVIFSHHFILKLLLFF